MFIKKKELLLCDVSLRDGLQSINNLYTLDEKKELLHKIIDNYSPNSIEVGSIVSHKIFPQMNNSLELYKYAQGLYNNIKYYLLIPNKEKLNIALNNDVKNMSFITSFSNKFQKKNINKTLNETKIELYEINKILESKKLCNNKLYLSCFNECPFEQKIDDNIILSDLLYYNKFSAFNELCLSDTTGNLDYNDYKRLIHHIINIIDVNKISLHLHCKKDNLDNITNIIKESINLNIKKFDVSCLDYGGCSITINKDKLNMNLNYNQLNNIF